MSRLEPLIEISRFYGDNPEFVIAGGGNTSYKDRETLWVKASGIPLAGISEDGFVSLSRKGLSYIEKGIFSDDPILREAQVKEQMKKAIIAPRELRPSVETSLHNLIDYAFVVHTHPTLVNALMCANGVKHEVAERFGKSAILVEYTDPGYILFKTLQQRIASYKRIHGRGPQIIFLQNHGVFVGADSVEEIKAIYADIDVKIREGKDLSSPSQEISTYHTPVTEFLSGYFDSRSLLTHSVVADIIRHFTASKQRLQLIAQPFSPDIIVYCKSSYLFLEPDAHTGDIQGIVETFENTHGYYPKVIVQESGGLTVVEENEKSLAIVKEVYLDLMKISYLSDQFGGPHFMSPDQIRFIDNWEVEHYRRKVAKGKGQ